MQSVRQGKKERFFPERADNEMDDDQSMNKSSYFMSIPNRQQSTKFLKIDFYAAGFLFPSFFYVCINLLFPLCASSLSYCIPPTPGHTQTEAQVILNLQFWIEVRLEWRVMNNPLFLLFLDSSSFQFFPFYSLTFESRVSWWWFTLCAIRIIYTCLFSWCCLRCNFRSLFWMKKGMKGITEWGMQLQEKRGKREVLDTILQLRPAWMKRDLQVRLNFSPNIFLAFLHWTIPGRNLFCIICIFILPFCYGWWYPNKESCWWFDPFLLFLYFSSSYSQNCFSFLHTLLAHLIVFAATWKNFHSLTSFLCCWYRHSKYEFHCAWGEPWRMKIIPPSSFSFLSYSFLLSSFFPQLYVRTNSLHEE